MDLKGVFEMNKKKGKVAHESLGQANRPPSDI
jgi:hypothetical protein